jgi:hypothetical protein
VPAPSAVTAPSTGKVRRLQMLVFFAEVAAARSWHAVGYNGSPRQQAIRMGNRTGHPTDRLRIAQYRTFVVQAGHMDIPSIALGSGISNISIESWLTIAAILLGPILALYAQRLLDSFREKRRRQRWVFRELMITRYTRLSPRYVEALNAVPIEFGGRGGEKHVVEKWKECLDHLGTDSKKNPGAWSQTSFELVIDLLFEMSKCLGYNFERLEIKREAYLPQMFADIEAQQHALRRQLLELTDGSGRRKLPVAVFEQGFPDLAQPPRDEE